MRPFMLHQPYEPYAYAKAETAAKIVLLVERGFASAVTVHYGDRYEVHMNHSVSMRLRGSDHRFDYFDAQISMPTGRLKYAFEVVCRSKSLWYGELGANANPEAAGVFQLPYLCERDIFRVPDWVNHAVCYQIFPDRFANGNPDLTPKQAEPWDSIPTATSVFGGNLPGITEHLDDLVSLGVNLIYLTPIFKAGSNHKYDTEDYFEIDPQFGTKDDLRNLVTQAHQKGIRVVLDAVFNHCGQNFAPFLDVRKKGKNSPFWNWFLIEGNEVDMATVNYETFGTKIAYMPKLNVAHPAVEKYLLNVATYWLQEFDIDGWRLDVANEIDHVFWRKFRERIHSVKRNSLIIGEVWHNSLPWVLGDQFDGVMNYVFREMVLAFFIRQNMSAQAFAEAAVQLLFRYPESAVCSMFNLLGSHDTERILTLADGDAGAVIRALAFQFTYPGIPMVYYGDEVGMLGGQDPDCRRGMVWNTSRQNQSLRSTVSKLARLKSTHPALGGTDLQFVHAKNGIIEYVRTSVDGTSAIRVAINNSKRSYHLVQPENLVYAFPEGIHGGRLRPGGVAIWEA